MLKIEAVAALLLAASSLRCGALPDLRIHGPSANPQIVEQTFSASDCEVVEGCGSAGRRRLLSFNTEFRNAGPSELILGDPGNNPLFEWAPCHGHYHFSNFAEYRLRSLSSEQVLTGRKMAFCVEDSLRWSDAARATRRYTCNYMGLSVGWADMYDTAVPCQFLDITDLPGGDYILELIADPNDLVAESNESNNVTEVPVSIPITCATPANDDFASASTMPVVPASAIGSSACATKETGEPNHAGDGGGHSVWYRWTASSRMPVLVTTIGSDFDTLLAVYTGSAVNNLTLITANDDIVLYQNRQSSLNFNAVQGTTYYIAVDGWQGASGRIVLNFNPPANDAFANCQSIEGPGGTVSGYNVAATKEQDELAHAGNIGGRSVWYCWTAPADAVINVGTAGSSFDTLLAVYTGSKVDALTLIASDNDSGPNLSSAVRFSAAAGQSYHVVVDGFSGASGNFFLRWGSPTNRLSIEPASGDGVRVSIEGSPGNYEIEFSTDFAEWKFFTNCTMTGTRWEITDPRPASSPRRFYRAASVR